MGQRKGRPLSFVRFEVPHRQQIASDPDSALFVRSGPFHHFLRPVNAELVSGGLFLCSSTALGTRNGLLRYGIRIRCSKRPPTVRDASSETCRAKSSLLPQRQPLQCAKRPPIGGEQT